MPPWFGGSHRRRFVLGGDRSHHIEKGSPSGWLQWRLTSLIRRSRRRRSAAWPPPSPGESIETRIPPPRARTGFSRRTGEACSRLPWRPLFVSDTFRSSLIQPAITTPHRSTGARTGFRDAHVAREIDTLRWFRRCTETRLDQVGTMGVLLKLDLYSRDDARLHVYEIWSHLGRRRL